MGSDRLALLYGGVDGDRRERIKAEFQHDPDGFPLRILLAIVDDRLARGGP